MKSGVVMLLKWIETSYVFARWRIYIFLEPVR